MTIEMQPGEVIEDRTFSAYTIVVMKDDCRMSRCHFGYGSIIKADPPTKRVLLEQITTDLDPVPMVTA